MKYRWLLGIATTASACVTPGSVDDAASPVEAVRVKAPASLWQAFDDHQAHDFIVALAPTSDPARWAEDKQRLRASSPDHELAVLHAWDELPLMHVQAASAEAARALLADDAAAAAYEDVRYELTDAESFPLIAQPAAIAAGKSGVGTSIAILDTGTTYTHAAFGSCTSPGVPAACKVSVAKDFAPDDGALDANGHGTNVAGIALGVAPDAHILALDVFTGSSASSIDIISAINWSVANRATYNIAALNLSLGGGSSTTPCTNDAMGIALATARTAGIAPVVASGNGGLTNAISSPGCAPAAISVGAVYDAAIGGLTYSACSDPTTAADKITCFSNSASFLTLLAPGALITAAGFTMAGTSQATPHVAGNHVTTSRIDVAAALRADVAPPTGTVALSPAAVAVSRPAVTLAITASDPSGVATMCLSSTTTCTTFVPFAATAAWTLPAGDGTKRVTVFLRDRVGNTTTATTSPVTSIVLDATAPTGGVVSATAAVAKITLAWTAATDALSGVSGYRLLGNAGTTTPAANCASGTTIYAGTGTSATHAVAAMATWTYRLCAIDRAGNVSAGSTVTIASP
ncbi:MAG: S8 family serine peptidase [Proteobacteria bacterium]|nr:S8 family serine peptidase [Pseudomonadota bacterium]